MSGGPTLHVIDLFSGAGGLALGFRAAGCRIAAAVDADLRACETFRRNFGALQPEDPPLVLAGPDYSLDRVPINALPVPCAPDILIGGPPCQAFSRLGRGKLDSLSEEGFVGDPRNKLYRAFLAAAAFWQPLAVVMENVPGMLTVAGRNYAHEITAELAELGYHTGYALLNAVWYGVPQYRERVFFIGIRGDVGRRPAVPGTRHDPVLPEGYRPPLRTQGRALPFPGVWERIAGELPVPTLPAPQPGVSVQEAIGDLPPLTDHLSGTSLPRCDFRHPLPYGSAPRGPYARLMRTWPGFPFPSAVSDHVVRRTPRDYDTFRLMRHGDHYPEALRIARQRFEEALRELEPTGTAPVPGSEAWKRLQDRYVPPYDEKDFPEKWGKLFPDRPSWTVPAHLAKDSYSHIHYDSEQARMISVREAARLQSFPDAFQFCGNVGDCFRQIGNAVPPLLAWALAAALLASLGNSPHLPPPWYRTAPGEPGDAKEMHQRGGATG